jgi:hypothetical protein
LHADFDRFEGTQEDVGDEFGGRAGAEVDDCLGRVGEEFLAVVVFEDFVGAVFARALEGVAGEGWGLERRRRELVGWFVGWVVKEISPSRRRHRGGLLLRRCYAMLVGWTCRC